jgi:hypothetical protein
VKNDGWTKAMVFVELQVQRNIVCILAKVITILLLCCQRGRSGGPPVEFPDVPYADVASELVSKFTPYKGPVEPDSFRNFLGVRTRCKYLPATYQAWAGKMQGLPVGRYSDGLHDAAEWCGVLSAVLEAEGQLVGVELGAGWAPWLVCATVAARQRGIAKQTLVAVEANSKNIEFLRTHFSDNDIVPEDHMIISGMCSTAARFDLAKLVAALPIVDFIHIDIQGHEAEVIKPALPALNRRVRRLIVGTHGRELDGIMFGLMSKNGWELEHEKTSVHRSPDLALVEDGSQVWKNQKIGSSRGLLSPIRKFL